MSEPVKPDSLLASALAEVLRSIVKEAVNDALNNHRDEDRLLDAEEAAKTLCVSVEWLYRNARRLPFTRKLGHKMLRFSSVGIQKYLAARKSA